MLLKDAVRTATNQVSSAAHSLSVAVRDRELPLHRRLESFSELIESEVGDTWMRRSKALARDFDLTDTYLKFEGDNPTGTQKDRIAFAQAEEALRREATAVTLATCGNYGVAVALACKLAALQCEVFLPAGYHSERVTQMLDLGATLHRPPGSYEDAVLASRLAASQNGWYDANPGGQNTELQLTAYAPMGREIVSDAPSPPVAIGIPVSNGTLLAGIHRGMAGTADCQLLAGSSVRKNPIVVSFQRGLTTCVDLDPARIRETGTNEPLINWHSFDGQEALDAVYASRGAAYAASDAELRKMASYLKERESLHVLPAATAGLVALIKANEAGLLPAGPRVAVITAKR